MRFIYAYKGVTLMIVKARLERFRHGHDVTLDMDDELYAVLKQHKMLRCAFLDNCDLDQVSFEIWQ